MIMAVIHAITLFSIYYLFHIFFIARRYGYVYIYLLTQVVLRSNHKKFVFIANYRNKDDKGFFSHIMLLMQLKSLVLTLFNLLNNSLSDFSVTYIIFPYLYLLMDGCFLRNTPLNINDNKLF